MIPFVAVEGERLDALLHRRRCELGLFYWQVGELLGRNYRCYIPWEKRPDRGGSIPRDESLRLVCEKFKVPYSYGLAAREHSRAAYPRVPSSARPGCGSIPGYWWHYRHKETICDPCRKVFNSKMNERYHRTRAPERMPCGTTRAARQHMAAGEVLCDLCLQALRDDRAAKRQAWVDAGIAARLSRLEAAETAPQGGPKTKELPPCGTAQAGYRHYARGEKPCDRCRAALQSRAREVYQLQHGNQPREPSGCGTSSGASAHYRRGETPCEECRQARNAYERERRRPVVPKIVDRSAIGRKAAQARWSKDDESSTS